MTSLISTPVYVIIEHLFYLEGPQPSGQRTILEQAGFFATLPLIIPPEPHKIILLLKSTLSFPLLH